MIKIRFQIFRLIMTFVSLGALLLVLTKCISNNEPKSENINDTILIKHDTSKTNNEQQAQPSHMDHLSHVSHASHLSSI